MKQHDQPTISTEQPSNTNSNKVSYYFLFAIQAVINGIAWLWNKIILIILKLFTILSYLSYPYKLLIAPIFKLCYKLFGLSYLRFFHNLMSRAHKVDNILETTKHNFDFYSKSLVLAVAILILFGIVMVQSSSVALVNSPNILIFSYLYPWIPAFIGLFVILSTPIKFYSRGSIIFGLIGCWIILLLLIFGIGGATHGGATRSFMGLFQPAEVLKLVMIIYFAHYINVSDPSKIEGSTGLRAFFKELLGYIVISFLCFVLLLLLPDKGAVMSMSLISLAMLFSNGIKSNIYFWIGLAVAIIFLIGFYYFIYVSPDNYITKRFRVVLNPFVDEFGTGYQPVISLSSFANGGLFGVGLGNSVAKFGFLNVLNTDFLFSIIGEELGIVGIIFVIALYCFIFYKLAQISYISLYIWNDTFKGMLVLGIIFYLAYQVFYNIGMSSSILPVDGTTLPLISYGGTSYVMYLAALGICFRVDYENRVKLLAWYKLEQKKNLKEQNFNLNYFKELEKDKRKRQYTQDTTQLESQQRKIKIN